MTFLVWILVVQLEVFSYQAGGPATIVIDNIASESECKTLGDSVLKRFDHATAANCFSVRKAK